MTKRYNNLQSVMDLPKGTVEEQREFIDAIFRDAWRSIYIGSSYSNNKYICNQLYSKYKLKHSVGFCNILTTILTQPYKELGYYHGDDGTYVDSFPPILIPLTQDQESTLIKMYNACVDYYSIKQALSNENLLLPDTTKKEIIHSLHFTYKKTMEVSILKLNDLFGIKTTLTQESKEKNT
ncbi:MAG: hypothetical protein IJ358_00595 [Clostridia bacterium]|nr:hypothetical protein [Clostridia bacterium]